ncbi:hypothetical protein [Paenibacillus typhae]|uniref:hypothetical protein n=1 Tax=Paenibacillus typhae TaxID=1174501 RepID=UPI001C8E0D38|nr:hypothetical protein [Paenibacillus typhae]MBY0012170.1 hypothetical protein [Paenibacillus typhae]
MKALRSTIGFLLLVIIVASLGYIGWYANDKGLISWNRQSTSTTNSNVHNQHSVSAAPEGTSTNPVTTLRERVSAAQQSMKQMATNMMAYPSEAVLNGSSVNDGETGGNASQQAVPGSIQVQKGIYSLSESVYLLAQLEQTLDNGMGFTESSNPTYETYQFRYNLLLQSQKTLSEVNTKLNEAKNGILLNGTGMMSSHNMQETSKAIYDMAQTVMGITSLNQWVERQIQQTVSQAQNVLAASTSNQDSSIFNGLGTPSLMVLIVGIFTILLVVALVGVIGSILTPRPETASAENHL